MNFIHNGQHQRLVVVCVCELDGSLGDKDRAECIDAQPHRQNLARRSKQVSYYATTQIAPVPAVFKMACSQQHSHLGCLSQPLHFRQ